MTDDAPLFSFPDLVRELAMAWKTLSVYPANHPACAGASDGALRQLRGLTAATGSFALGIARDALLADDERITGSHAQRLAERLHLLGVGVVRFHEGLRHEELDSFLRELRQEPGKAALVSLGERLAHLGVERIAVEGRDFSHLVATDDLDTPLPRPVAGAGPTSLWERILGNQLLRGPGGGADEPATLERVIALINRYLPAAATSSAGRGGIGAGGVTGHPAGTGADHAGGGHSGLGSAGFDPTGTSATGSGGSGGGGGGGGAGGADNRRGGAVASTDGKPGEGAGGGAGGDGRHAGPDPGRSGADVQAAAGRLAAGPGQAQASAGPTQATAVGGGETGPGGVGAGTTLAVPAAAAPRGAAKDPTRPTDPTPSAGGTRRGGPQRGVHAGATTGTGGSGDDDDGPVLAPELATLMRRVQDAVGAQTETAVASRQLFLLRQVGELIGALPRGLREQVLATALERLAGEQGSTAGLDALSATLSATELVSALRRLRSEHRRLAQPAVAWLDGLHRAGVLAKTTPPAATAAELQGLLAEPEDRPMLRADEPMLELPPVAVKVEPLGPELRREAGSLKAWQQTAALLRKLIELLDVTAEPAAAGAVLGRLEGLFLQLLAGLRLPAAKALFDHLENLRQRSAGTPLGDTVAGSLDHLRGRATVDQLIDLVPTLQSEELAAVQDLVRHLGRPLVRNLLYALGEEEDRPRRRVIFDFAKGLSTSVVDEARELLDDPRWYVVRNMIALLHAVGDQRVGPDLQHCLEHPDARVRLEALRDVGEISKLPRELVHRLLRDPDPKIAARMERLAGNLGSDRTTAPLLQVVTSLDPLGRHREQRIRALLALGEIGDPAVLPKIKRYFSTLAVDHPDERRAAFQSLAGYPAAARAPWVDKGLRSRDPQIRAVCERLATGDVHG